MALCDAVTVMRAGAVVLDCAIADTRRRPGRSHGRAAREPRPRWRDHDDDTGRRAGEAQGLALDRRAGRAAAGRRVRQRCAPARSSVSGAPATARANPSTCTGDFRRRQPAGGRRTFTPARRWLDPPPRAHRRIAHVPEDRHQRGLGAAVPAWESAVLAISSGRATARAGWMRRRTMHDDAQDDGTLSTCARANPICARPSSAAATSRSWCWRAKPRPSPGAAGGPAHARRGHRRHRVHPRPPARDARRRRQAVLVVSASSTRSWRWPTA